MVTFSHEQFDRITYKCNKQTDNYTIKAMARLPQDPPDNDLVAACTRSPSLCWLLRHDGFPCGRRALQREPRGGAPPAPGCRRDGTGQPSPAQSSPTARAAIALGLHPRGAARGYRKKKRKRDTPTAPGTGGGRRKPRRAVLYGRAAAERRVLPGAMRGRGLLCGIALSLLLRPPPRECGVTPGGGCPSRPPQVPLGCRNPWGGRMGGWSGVRGVLQLLLQPAQTTPSPPRLRVL